MNHILLLGAGFTRNWGGWLAAEAFEYLLGCSELDADLKGLLWKHKRSGGFEGALAELQQAQVRNSQTPDPNLAKFQKALSRMFDDMNRGLSAALFEFQNDMKFQVKGFLERFHAIFTLNQDLLLERHYLHSTDQIGKSVPGMKLINPSSREHVGRHHLGKLMPDPEGFHVDAGCQPYFKLHGSSNWVDGQANQLLIMGGNKASIIDRYPILKWTAGKFDEYLAKDNTRLVIIGYSFGDDHINNALRKAAASKKDFSLFIVDPLGVDVIDKNRNLPIYMPDQLLENLRSHVAGASRRSLGEIFRGDHTELAKIMRFIE